MTTIDRRVRTVKWIEFWIPAGSGAKDFLANLREASKTWHNENNWAWEPGWLPDGPDDWFTIHPHDEHVIIRIKCPDEAS